MIRGRMVGTVLLLTLMEGTNNANAQISSLGMNFKKMSIQHYALIIDAGSPLGCCVPKHPINDRLVDEVRKTYYKPLCWFGQHGLTVTSYNADNKPR